MPDSHIFLGQLRNEMRYYQVKTGNSPFPNVKGAHEKYQEAIEKKDLSRASFYYLLCEYGGEGTRPFSLFENDQEMLKQFSELHNGADLINDGLFNLPKEYFVSEPLSE